MRDRPVQPPSPKAAMANKPVATKPRPLETIRSTPERRRDGRFERSAIIFGSKTRITGSFTPCRTAFNLPASRSQRRHMTRPNADLCNNGAPGWRDCVVPATLTHKGRAEASPRLTVAISSGINCPRIRGADFPDWNTRRARRVGNAASPRLVSRNSREGKK